jgi:tetratricopeptide (TPR) repeat protein
LWLKIELWFRPCFFAFAYFTVALLPVVGLIDNFIFHYSLVFDHFQYLASIGPLALAGAGLTRFLDFFIPKKAWLQFCLCAELLLILGLTSWGRTLVYQGPETLWTDTLAKNPNCWVGDNNLGLLYSEKGQLDEAVQLLQRALEINPQYAESYSNLGLTLFRQGRVDEAIANYQKALEMIPRSFVTHTDLGTALFQKGKVESSIVEYEKALAIKPNYEEARSKLGVALHQEGELDEARAEALAKQRDGKK